MSNIRAVIEHYAGKFSGDKLISGIGLNDANYIVKREQSYYEGGKRKRKLVWICPFYEKWKSMIDRCYNDKMREKYPTYIDCEVCDEWLIFSNFKAWMETQDWEGKQLDKDLLFVGNKIYSPNHCTFIDNEINSFISSKNTIKFSELMTGVHHHHTGKFRAVIRDNGKYKHLGVFETEIEAHNKWYCEKIKIAESLALKYSLNDVLQKALMSKIHSLYEGDCVQYSKSFATLCR